jgi:tetratricopeptide (TPR) repeat protein
MSYDAGRHGIAQRYFVQALRLAQAADQVLLAATILDAMSHQATFLGRLPVAVNLTRAASAGAASLATPTQQAHFLAMEARAHAAAGDVASAERALSRAVRTFERRTDGNDPAWISYFDDAELAAEFAHCYRDLGRGDEAVRYANMGLKHVAPTPRSDYFVTMVLAAGHLAAGDVEAACGVAGDAAVWGASLKSARAADYLRQFRSKLAPYGGVEAVGRFDERLAGVATN